MHASVCALITLLIAVLFFAINQTLLAACVAGFLTAMAAGLAKEYGDYCNPNNKWDWYDVLADACGSALMLILIIVVYIII